MAFHSQGGVHSIHKSLSAKMHGEAVAVNRSRVAIVVLVAGRQLPAGWQLPLAYTCAKPPSTNNSVPLM